MSTSSTQAQENNGGGETIDESLLLGHCPNCDYELTGLPIQWNCPECGMSVDRRWRVFGGGALKHRKTEWFEPAKVALVAAPLLSIAWVLIATLTIPVPYYVKHTMTWTPVLMVVLFTILILRKPKRCIILSPDGLLVLNGKKIIDRYDWRDISRAEHDFFRKSIAIKYKNKTVRFKNIAYFGVTIDEVDRCIAASNRARTEYRARDDQDVE